MSFISKELPSQMRSVEFAWTSSKNYLSDFIRSLALRVVVKDPDYKQKHRHSGPSLQRLFYDLGHTGRGFDSFPKTIKITGLELESSKKDEDSQSEFEIKLQTTISEFLKAITAQIAEYLRKHKFYKINGEGYEKTIASLEGMVAVSQGWKATITFQSRFENGVFEVTEINYLPLTEEELSNLGK